MWLTGFTHCSKQAVNNMTTERPIGLLTCPIPPLLVHPRLVSGEIWGRGPTGEGSTGQTSVSSMQTAGVIGWKCVYLSVCVGGGGGHVACQFIEICPLFNILFFYFIIIYHLIFLLISTMGYVVCCWPCVIPFIGISSSGRAVLLPMSIFRNGCVSLLVGSIPLLLGLGLERDVRVTAEPKGIFRLFRPVQPVK